MRTINIPNRFSTPAIPLMLAALLAGCGAHADKASEGREQIFPGAKQIEPLFEGMPAPSFTVRRPDGSDFHFAPSSLQSPTVVFFYRGGWCPYCNAQLMELRNVEDKIEAMGFQQLYLSADSPATLEKGLSDPGKEERPDYEILSDNDLVAAKKFGIAFKVDEDTLQRYAQYGIDLAAASGREHLSLPVPAVFIVNAEGIITFAYANPDYRFRLHPDVLLAAAGVAQDGRNVRERAKR